MQPSRGYPPCLRFTRVSNRCHREGAVRKEGVLGILQDFMATPLPPTPPQRRGLDGFDVACFRSVFVHPFRRYLPLVSGPGGFDVARFRFVFGALVFGVAFA